MAGGPRSPARRGAVCSGLALLTAACFLFGILFGVGFGIGAPAAAASRNARSAAAPPTPASRPHRAVSPVIPAAPVTPPVISGARSGIGICQCVGDHDRRNINCLGNADACKATCGDHYSFVPNAPSCPLTAQVGG